MVLRGGQNMNKTINIVIVGVGGQGLITIGRILGNAAILKNVGALVSEVHGLAQRGGSVIVHARIGNPHSPLVPLGGAHALLGLELAEVIRYLPYVNRNTLLVVNRRFIRPSVPKARMPPIEDTLAKLREKGLKVIDMNAFDLAVKAGSPVSENIVMLGGLIATNVLGGILDIDAVREAIKYTFHPRWHEINLKALQYGYDAVKEFFQEDKATK